MSQSWTRSKNALPENDVPVLGVLRDGTLAVVVMVTWDEPNDLTGQRMVWRQWQDQQRDEPVVDGDFDNTKDVTHWTHLPEPPWRKKP